MRAHVTWMALVPGLAFGQVTNAPPAFDAASIRRNVDNIGRCTPDELQPSASGFRMTNCPLLMALGTAYVPTSGEALGFVIGLGDRVVGIPDWMLSENYDIVARIGGADAEAWKDEAQRRKMLRAMLQALLAERCKLVVHRGTRDKPVYAIVVGKNGPKLKAAETTDLDTLHAKHPNTNDVPGGGGVVGEGKNGGSGLYGATIGTLALALTYPAGRPVVDKTGLTGRYDIDLPHMQTLSPTDQPDGAPTVFSVLEDLGLRLEPRKEPVEVLVLDHVERPTAN
jgi:uncharacterized protein (TIGR03435 family)